MNLDFLQNNPALSSISKDKLEFLLQFASQNFSNNPNDMASQLQGAATQARAQGYTFSSAETTILIELLKQQMSPEEQQKADRILKLMHTFQPH